MPSPDQARDLPIHQIAEPFSLLRLVHKGSIGYLEMRGSIESHGLWNSISVRPSERHPGQYEIIDGLHRFTICKELQHKTIPCIIKHGVTDEEVLAAQIAANAVRPETKPVEFAQQIKRMLTLRPEMTVAMLSQRIGKSPKWINTTLGLLGLSKDLQLAVDRGEVPLQSAYLLVKMPPILRAEYVDQAKSMSPAEFKPLAASVIKHFKESVKQGRMDQYYSRHFEPIAYCRSFKEILAEHDQKDVGGPLVVSEGCRTPLDGFYAAIRWILHLDKASVATLQEKARARERRSVILQSKRR